MVSNFFNAQDTVGMHRRVSAVFAARFIIFGVFMCFGARETSSFDAFGDVREAHPLQHGLRYRLAREQEFDNSSPPPTAARHGIVMIRHLDLPCECYLCNHSSTCTRSTLSGFIAACQNKTFAIRRARICIGLCHIASCSSTLCCCASRGPH